MALVQLQLAALKFDLGRAKLDYISLAELPRARGLVYSMREQLGSVAPLGEIPRAPPAPRSIR